MLDTNDNTENTEKNRSHDMRRIDHMISGKNRSHDMRVKKRSHDMRVKVRMLDTNDNTENTGKAYKW